MDRRGFLKRIAAAGLVPFIPERAPTPPEQAPEVVGKGQLLLDGKELLHLSAELKLEIDSTREYVIGSREPTTVFGHRRGELIVRAPASEVARYLPQFRSGKKVEVEYHSVTYHCVLTTLEVGPVIGYLTATIVAGP